MSKEYFLSAQVKKELRRLNFNADELLRKALAMPNEGFLTSDGKRLPEGTILVAWFKGKAIDATIRNGMINAGDKSYSSLSGAAAHFTGRPTTNGWDLWYAKLPTRREFIPVKKAAQLPN